MAFAPKVTPTPPGTPADTGTRASKSKSSVASASGKAAQRARNKASGAGAITNSGSSGAALRIAKAPKRMWEEIEDDVVHLTDVAGKISHSQVGSSGYLISTLSVPLEYAHDLLDVHLKARDGLVYIRVYYVSLEDYLGPMEDMEELTDTFDPYELK